MKKVSSVISFIRSVAGVIAILYIIYNLMMAM